MFGASQILHKLELNIHTVKDIGLYEVIRGGGYTLVQVVEALRYKLEGHEFDSERCHWIFSLTQFFRLHYGP